MMPSLEVGTTLAIVVTFIAFGIGHDLWAKRADRRVARARLALGTMLFGDEEEAEQAFAEIRRVPRPLLLRLAQTVVVDFGNAGEERIRRLVRSSGAARRIRVLARQRVWSNRTQAAQLTHLLPDTDPVRARLLCDRHPWVRARAVDALHGRAIVEHAEVLLAMLDDPSRPVRIAVQEALLRSGSQLSPQLGFYLCGPDREGTTLALIAAANIPDPRLAVAILRHAHDEDPARRAAVAYALGVGLGVDVLEPLLQLSRDDDALVRAAAANAIGARGDVELAARLGHMLSDKSWGVRREAGLALDALGPAGAVVLRANLSARDRYARDMARQMLDAAATRRRLPPVLLPEALVELEDPAGVS